MKYVIDDQVMNELRSLQVKRAEKYILIISPVLIFVISEIVREYGSRIAYEAWLKALVVAITFTIFRFSNSKSISKLINKISAQQGDASEPATNADSALQHFNPPAR